MRDLHISSVWYPEDVIDAAQLNGQIISLDQARNWMDKNSGGFLDRLSELGCEVLQCMTDGEDWSKFGGITKNAGVLESVDKHV